MAKEKEELTIDDVLSKKESDISNILDSYVVVTDKNYQNFLKALISEVDIVNMVSNIDQKNLSNTQKKQIDTIKVKFYEDFLESFQRAYDTFSQ